MFTKIKSQKMELTPKIAERLLLLNTFEGQRQLRPWWVSELANRIRDGVFTCGHVAIAIYTNGSGEPEKFQVNGQHQCNGVLVANKSVDVMYEEYDCGTDMENVSYLYRQFDSHAGRSIDNLVKMELLALKLDWPVRIGQLVVRGASLLKGQEGAHKNHKIALIKAHIEHGNFVNNILTCCSADEKKFATTKHLLRGSVVHAMILTYEKSQKSAKDFWENVRDGEGLKKSQPEYVLREFLKDTSINRGRGATVFKNRTCSDHEVTSKCISAWNAYRRGEKTVLKYFASKPIPKAF